VIEKIKVYSQVCTVKKMISFSYLKHLMIQHIQLTFLHPRVQLVLDGSEVGMRLDFCLGKSLDVLGTLESLSLKDLGWVMEHSVKMHCCQ